MCRPRERLGHCLGAADGVESKVPPGPLYFINFFLVTQGLEAASGVGSVKGWCKGQG